MHLVKFAFISFLILFGIIFLISLLFPSQLRISRATNLPNKRQQIFRLLENEKDWHPAYSDSTSAKAIKEMSRSEVQRTDSTYSYVLQQQGRKKVGTGWEIYGAPNADSLTLQWYMDFRFSWYPWEKFSSLFYERTYGTMMETGLGNIKKKISN